MERIYTRGSDDRIKTENQLADLRKEAPGAVLYEDVMSGSKNRPRLEQMIAESVRGDVVWIWSLDRLSRQGIHATLDYLKRLTSKGVRVRSCKEPWLDSSAPCYEIIVSCMAFAAQMERNRLIERVTTGIRRARKETGKPLLNKVAIAQAEGTLREVAAKFGCSAVYVLKCRRQQAGQ
jgi:DNA invertase Pin-like site-specific DNA recombinase